MLKLDDPVMKDRKWYSFKDLRPSITGPSNYWYP